MISITPQGEIYLCKTPLENDYKNQLTFSNATSQNTYFTSKIFKTLDNYTYIKKDNILKVGFPIDEIIGCNYLFYRNEGFTNKIYYCFITKMEYVNENCTQISFETDVWQTYQFNIIYNPCFVEREHVNDDTIGKNTLPENVELGEYICNKISYSEFGGKDDTLSGSLNAYIVVGVSVDSEGDGVVGNTYDGLYSALKYYAFPHTTNGINDLNTFIQSYSIDGRNEAIRVLFLVPEKLVGFVSQDHSLSASNTIGMHWINLHGHEDDQTGLNKMIDITTNKLQNYVPRNNKLLTAPYRYMKVSNNNGIDVTYNYEDFVIDANNGNATFIIYSCLAVGGSVRMVPMNYKGVQYNHDEGINLGKFPTLSWVNDEFINWLTQNAVNIGISALGNITQIVGGALMLTGGATALTGASSILSGVSGIAGTLGQVYQHNKVPTQVEGNINSGDVITASNKNDFIFYDMSIKEQYARILDSYFDMYGYKVNTVKIPNIEGRQNWNFVKTIECNFEGDIPQEHLQIIKRIFNNGITLWHNANTMYNYNNSNNIVS